MATISFRGHYGSCTKDVRKHDKLILVVKTIITEMLTEKDIKKLFQSQNIIVVMSQELE